MTWCHHIDPYCHDSVHSVTLSYTRLFGSRVFDIVWLCSCHTIILLFDSHSFIFLLKLNFRLLNTTPPGSMRIWQLFLHAVWSSATQDLGSKLLQHFWALSWAALPWKRSIYLIYKFIFYIILYYSMWYIYIVCFTMFTLLLRCVGQ